MAIPNTSTVVLPARIRYGRVIYRLIAWFFAACVMIQIFIAGMAIFVEPTRWAWHRTFAHMLELLPISLIVLSFVASLPTRMKWVSAIPFLQLWLQYATTGIGGLAAAFHPVNAVLMFWVLVMLAQRAVPASTVIERKGPSAQPAQTLDEISSQGVKL